MEDSTKYQHQKKPSLIVIGGGAAGFFTAVNAARLNPLLEVTIVEKSNKVLSKVKISGGGRCNVTHACFDRAELPGYYPRGRNFVKKAFHQFFTSDTIRWFEERGVQLKAETDGRMFPVTDSSQTIIDSLLREASRHHVNLMLQRDVKQVKKTTDKWKILFADGKTIEADYLCIAAGGFPKPEQFDWIRETGHAIVSPVPSLFTFNMPGNSITALMGVSVPDTTVKIIGNKLQWRGPVLITHWGLSGPAVLKLSAWGATELHALQYRFGIMVNWLGDAKEPEIREQLQVQRNHHGAKKVANANVFRLPTRLWEYLLAEAEIKASMRWADVPAKSMNKLVQLLCCHNMQVSGKTTFKEEFVTAGGVDLAEIDPQTMQSKLQETLYFAGEIMNVDGITGGFNFQHAWTSGFIAASAIASSSLHS